MAKTRPVLRTVLLTFAAIFCMQAPHAQSPLPALQPLWDSIQAHARAQDFSGSVLVMKGNEELFHFDQGLATLPSGAPLSKTTRYNIGSAGKTFTGILIMQLVANGTLALDSPVSRYLTQPYQFTNSSNITVRQLLSHTSGLGDFFDSPNYDEQKTRSTDDHFRLVQNMKAPAAPGKEFLYSNSGFIVLGKVLELVYHQDYQQLVRQRILWPAGVRPGAPGSYATGYRKEKDQWIEGEGNDRLHWTAAGGIALSPVQLHRIMHRVVEHRYLSARYTDTMWAPTSHPDDDPPFVHYALGWMVEQPRGLSLVGHNGGVRGFQMAFRYLPQYNWYIYVFSNRENGAAPLFMDIIMTLIKDRQPG